MNREQKYDKVNNCETFEELASVIESFAEADGMIQGRSRKFSANKMSHFCMSFKNLLTPNTLTREFGIRQQAMYINYYD